MALLTDFTSYAEIRAALGVSSDEIADTTLALPLFLNGLIADLESVAATLPDDYAVAIAVVSPPALTQKFIAGVALFSAYAVAVQLGSSLPLFSPKDIGDGKATLGRYAADPYKEALKDARRSFSKFRTLLEARYAAYKSTTTIPVVRPFLGISVPSTDPVTG